MIQEKMQEQGKWGKMILGLSLLVACALFFGVYKHFFANRKDGHEYVDLGLPSGTKWATCNVGASKPTEYGDSFAWGETKPKEDYSLGTYKWGVADAAGFLCRLPKYNYSSEYYGAADNKMVLEPADDAATANWGNSWRMPTAVEINELIDGCSWDWVENFNGSGVNGRLGTSKVNGATIFLPAAGYRRDTGTDGTGGHGHYWSSSLSDLHAYLAHSLYLYDGRGSYSGCGVFSYSRYDGQSVRAVLR